MDMYLNLLPNLYHWTFVKGGAHMCFVYRYTTLHHVLNVSQQSTALVV